MSYLPDIHRLLPQAPDSEKALISVFWQWPEEVGPVIVNRGLLPTHFHIPAYRTLFDELFYRYQERLSLDFVAVGRALIDAGKIESIGGAAFLSDAFGHAPSAAVAPEYIDTLLAKHAAREGIRLATEAAADLYDPTANPVELLHRLREAVQQIEERGGTLDVERLLSVRAYNPQKPPAEPLPVFTLGEAIIATPGNLLAVQAKAKAGKTGFLSALDAAAMAPSGDCLGLSSANPNQWAFVHFDTEQSPYDHYQVMQRVMRRVGRAEPPPWFRSYCVTDLPMQVRRTLFKQELERAHRAHGGILAVVLDGIADLCMNPNDEEEAFQLVDELHQLAIRYGTVIVCVLHENPGSEIGKTRGHLGSQLERKAETNLRLEKDADGVTVIFAERARHAHIPKNLGTCFQWNDEAKMHLTIDSVPRESGKFTVKHTKATIIERLSVIDGVKPVDLRKELSEFCGMSKSTFYRFIGDLKAEKKVIEKHGLWYLAPK